MLHEPLTSKGLRQAIPRVIPWSQLSPKPRPTLKGLFLPLSLGGPLSSLPHSSDISLSPSLREQPSPLFGFLLIRCGFCTFSQKYQKYEHFCNLPASPGRAPTTHFLFVRMAGAAHCWGRPLGRRLTPQSQAWVDPQGCWSHHVPPGTTMYCLVPLLGNCRCLRWPSTAPLPSPNIIYPPHSQPGSTFPSPSATEQ